MLRVVIDANVFVSALIRPEGPPGRVLERLLKEREFVLVASAAILDEIRRSLGYSRVRRYVDASDDEIEAWVTSLGVVADIVAGEVELKVVMADPDDDIYVAAALEGRADYIVTGDRHLLDLVEVQGVRLIKPRAFLDKLDDDRTCDLRI